MAVPQNHKSRSRRDMRRSHDALSAPALGLDKSTETVHLSHCLTKDGYYRGQKFDLTRAAPLSRVKPSVKKTEQDQA